MQIDLSNFFLSKITEEDRYIWYKFEVKIMMKSGIDKKNRPMIIYQSKYGTFRFDKNELVEINALEVLKDETDQYLHTIINQLTAKFLVKMIECKKTNTFPDKIHLVYW